MISIIVATDNKGGIGKDNQLLWHLPNDLKRFKFITNNHVIIMGRKTFESIGRVLPNRTNVVITRNKDLVFDGCVMCSSLEQAIEKYAKEDVFIIGGGEIYKQAMAIADRVYLTKVDTELEADTHFQELSEKDWEVTLLEKHSTDEKHPYNYTFINYQRR
jgi:dihydrofolate reductase